MCLAATTEKVGLLASDPAYNTEHSNKVEFEFKCHDFGVRLVSSLTAMVAAYNMI
jgi:hypothetical protein